MEEEPQEEVEQNGNEVIVVEDSVTGEKKTTQWVNEATKAKKSLSMSLRGLKKLREIINLSIIMAEQATDLQGFMDALNGSINGTAGLITCDDKNGWMDLSFCRHKCPERCYKYNTGRWICSLLRCSNEKITLCDEKNGHCQSFDIIMGFADRYTTETFRIEKELESNGNNN